MKKTEEQAVDKKRKAYRAKKENRVNKLVIMF